MKKSRLSESQIVAILQQQEAALDGNNLPQGPYTATLISANNYYPFGMLQPGRHWTASEYRYGYNGKEMDHEMKGEGNSYDFGARIYDPRVGKFLTLDPYIQSFSSLSPYHYAGNTPICAVDKDGEYIYIGSSDYNVLPVLDIVSQTAIGRTVLEFFASNPNVHLYIGTGRLAMMPGSSSATPFGFTTGGQDPSTSLPQNQANVKSVSDFANMSPHKYVSSQICLLILSIILLILVCRIYHQARKTVYTQMNMNI